MYPVHSLGNFVCKYRGKTMFQGENAETFVQRVYSQLSYSPGAMEKNISVTVRIGFVIDEDGSLSYQQLLTGLDIFNYIKYNKYFQRDYRQTMSCRQNGKAWYDILLIFKPYGLLRIPNSVDTSTRMTSDTSFIPNSGF
jgi:hypothetical protein